MNNRRAFLKTTGVAAALAATCGTRTWASDKSPTWKSSDKAAKFLKGIIAMDSLNANFEQTATRPEMWDEYYTRALTAGITATGVTTAQGINDFDTFTRETSYNLRKIDADDRFMVVRTAGDIRRAHEEGKHGFYWNSQSAEILNNQPDVYMPVAKAMGLATMGLAYNERQRAGDGNFVLNPGPISAYGKTVVDAMQRHRVLVDTSHASEPTALSTIEYAKKTRPDLPTIETHSSVHALYSGYPEGEIRLRTSSDERIQAVADTGGVVSLCMLPFIMISPQTETTRPQDIVDRIDYMRKLTSIDNVALSSDDGFDWSKIYEFGKTNPEQFDDGGLSAAVNKLATTGIAEPAKIYAAVIDEMWSRGYSDEDVKKVMGGNLMRIYEQVWG